MEDEPGGTARVFVLHQGQGCGEQVSMWVSTRALCPQQEYHSLEQQETSQVEMDSKSDEFTGELFTKSEAKTEDLIDMRIDIQKKYVHTFIKVLKESLKPDCFITMVYYISTSVAAMQETISTLRFSSESPTTSKFNVNNNNSLCDLTGVSMMEPLPDLNIKYFQNSLKVKHGSH